MVENPDDRLFDSDKHPEVFLNLSNLLICNYYYTVSKNLGNDLEKEYLKIDMYKNLTNMKQKQIKVTR